MLQGSIIWWRPMEINLVLDIWGQQAYWLACGSAPVSSLWCRSELQSCDLWLPQGSDDELQVLWSLLHRLLFVLSVREPASGLQGEICFGTWITAPRQSQDHGGTRYGRGDFGGERVITEHFQHGFEICLDCDRVCSWLWELCLTSSAVSPPGSPWGPLFSCECNPFRLGLLRAQQWGPFSEGSQSSGNIHPVAKWA